MTWLQIRSLAGSLAVGDVLDAPDTGLYIDYPWYLNFSDRNQARITAGPTFTL